MDKKTFDAIIWNEFMVLYFKCGYSYEEAVEKTAESIRTVTGDKKEEQ